MADAVPKPSLLLLLSIINSTKTNSCEILSKLLTMKNVIQVVDKKGWFCITYSSTTFTLPPLLDYITLVNIG